MSKLVRSQMSFWFVCHFDWLAELSGLSLPQRWKQRSTCFGQEGKNSRLVTEGMEERLEDEVRKRKTPRKHWTPEEKSFWEQSSVVVLEISLGLQTGLKSAFEGLGLVLKSNTFWLGLVSVSDIADSGFLIKTSQDHNRFICLHNDVIGCKTFFFQMQPIARLASPLNSYK